MSDTRLRPLLTWRSAICDSDLPSTSRHVALTLSLWMNERGASAFPGAPELSKATALSERAVREHLTRLVDAGWLVLARRGGLKGERKMANEYRARIPDAPDPSSPVTGDPASPVTETAPEVVVPEGCSASNVTGDPASPITETAPTGDPDDRDGSSSVTPSLEELSSELSNTAAPLETSDATPGTELEIITDANTVATIASRPRDLLWEAILEATRTDADGITASARGAYNRARQSLGKAGAEPDGGGPNDVHVRARVFAARWPDATCTPTALERRWAECDPRQQRGQISSNRRALLDVAASRGALS